MPSQSLLRRQTPRISSQAGSLAASVVAKAAARDGGGGSATLQYSMSRRVPLSGRELADYYEAAEQQVNEISTHAVKSVQPASKQLSQRVLLPDGVLDD
jgi:hypothetical protein